MAKSPAAKARQRHRAASAATPKPDPRKRAALIVAALVVALAATLVILALLPESNGTMPPGDEGPVGATVIEVNSRQHVSGTVTYAQTPPVGGDHAPVWQNCGAYRSPIPKEQAVHSLEHGAVWLTYGDELPDDERAALERIAQDQRYVLISPWFPGEPLGAPIVASAWGRQLRLQTTSDPRLDEFARNYQKGAQTPEPGAPCNRGTGQPL